MSDAATIILGIMIPLAGTTLGAGFVFLLRGEIRPVVQKVMLGFASGVMIAASVWSLLIPAIDMAREQGVVPWMPAAAGFLAGIGFLLVLDSLIPHLHLNADKTEGRKAALNRSTMLVLAVTLHNLPEGMAVGVVFAGMISGNYGISTASAFALAIGIALQNIPEGAVISMPLAGHGTKKGRAFLLGMLSGAVEPMGALLTLALISIVTPALPYILSFASGAMIYVVVEDLIPEAQFGEHSNMGTISTGVGFALMMVLDVALS